MRATDRRGPGPFGEDPRRAYDWLARLGRLWCTGREANEQNSPEGAEGMAARIGANPEAVVPAERGSQRVATERSQRHEHRGQRGELTMTSLQILGVAALAFVIPTPDAMAQTRGGGAVSGGIRESVSDGIIGVSEAVGTGAKTGVVTEATRAAIDREKQARARYQNTADYRNAQHSDFAKARAEVGADLGKATKSG